MSTHILLAGFGSTHPRARAALERVLDRARAAFPGIPCALAYTSGVVRERLARNGEAVPSVAEALDRLRAQGVDRVAIQSLHVIPGAEFHELLALANERTLAPGGFARIEVGFPLLAGEQGIERAAEALIALAPGRRPGEAVLLMGHGSLHPGNAYYEGLLASLARRDPSVLVGAMRAEPGLDTVIGRLAAAGARKVYLLPLLFGAGRHVENDMQGPDPDSWEAALVRAGIECEAVAKGAGEYDRLADIWLDHLRDALERLGR
jgi:sirohydrochlorin cobaltochelatase